MRTSRKSEAGQILQGVIMLLILMCTLIPLMVFYAQRESKWTDKQNRTTQAFHLAEAGIEKAYLALSLSSATWLALQNGVLINDYKFDKSYHDVNGGAYAISITSGPDSQEATVVSVGTDRLRREFRAIKAIYGNAPLGGVAIYGGRGVDVSGNNLTVEWGGIVSPADITPNGANHPSYWTAGNVIGFDSNGATPPNCDQPNCWWWHSFQTNIPPAPAIDFTFYRSSAQAADAAGGCTSTSNTAACPCGLHYTPAASAPKTGGCSDSSGQSYYVDGDWTGFDGPIIGSVVISGSLSTGNGVMSGGNVNALMPRQAWKQYCNDWSGYLAYGDSTAASLYPSNCPGIYSQYLSAATLFKNISPVVNGMLYIGTDFHGPNGGGNTTLVYGVLYVKGTVYLNSNSHVKVYYGDGASKAMHTTQVDLVRVSWQDDIAHSQWPTGLSY